MQSTNFDIAFCYTKLGVGCGWQQQWLLQAPRKDHAIHLEVPILEKLSTWLKIGEHTAAWKLNFEIAQGVHKVLCDECKHCGMHGSDSSEFMTCMVVPGISMVLDRLQGMETGLIGGPLAGRRTGRMAGSQVDWLCA